MMSKQKLLEGLSQRSGGVPSAMASATLGLPAGSATGSTPPGSPGVGAAAVLGGGVGGSASQLAAQLAEIQSLQVSASGVMIEGLFLDTLF